MLPIELGESSYPNEALMDGDVLIVDDEPILLAGYERVLAQAGFNVYVASNGRRALELTTSKSLDCVVSDVNMPGMSGVDLLQALRDRDLDLPVVLLSGEPTVTTAMRAIEHGALQYLTKPIDAENLTQVVARAARLGRLARLKRQALEVLGDGSKLFADPVGLEAAFTRALESLWMVYQPIVNASTGHDFAYEALVRSVEPTLPHAGALLDAAERLDRLFELGRVIRDKSAAAMEQAQSGTLLFVNLHPRDLLDETLMSEHSPLGRIASRVVLEITERAPIERIPDASARVAALRKTGFRIAIDDLGAGYAGFSSFVHLEPEVVKLDMSLVRGVDSQPTKRKIVRSMTRLCKEMGILVVAEGIETVAERDVMVECGCEFLQGYLFARPNKSLPVARTTSARVLD